MNATNYLEQGLKQAAQMDYEGVIQAFDDALGLDHDLVDVYYNRGSIYSRLGCQAAAIDHLSRALLPTGDRPKTGPLQRLTGHGLLLPRPGPPLFEPL